MVLFNPHLRQAQKRYVQPFRRQMKNTLLLFLTFICTHIFAQDTLYSLKTYVNFLPGETAVSEDIFVSIKKLTVTSIATEYNLSFQDHRLVKKIIHRNKIVSKKNREALCNSFKWIENHRYDTIFNFDLKTIDWDSLKSVAKKWRWTTYSISADEIDSFRLIQNGQISINTKNLCLSMFEGRAIDGGPYDIKFEIKSNHFIDTIRLKDNVSSKHVQVSNIRIWLLLYSVTTRADIYLQLPWMNNYFKSDEIFYLILIRDFYWRINGCT